MKDLFFKNWQIRWMGKLDRRQAMQLDLGG